MGRLVFVLIFALYCFGFEVERCVQETDSYCFHETCALPLYDEHIGLPCACSSENIGQKFGPCVDGTRDLIYFWRPPATCLNGTLPFPVSGFPCDQRCEEGLYLNVTSKTCAPCNAGTISFGTGHTYDEWNDWPGQMSTHCAIGDLTRTCSGWVLSGENINSGDNHLLNYLESTLEYRVEILFPGWVSFRYRVDAELNYDGMYFIVDDLSYFFESQKDWSVYNLSLSVGYHTISWKYYKDRLLTVGRDRVDIDWIQVSGTTFGAIDCESCPAGHYQPEPGQSKCIPCEPGTYMPTTGAKHCLPCGNGRSSFAGAISCYSQEMCSDMKPYFYSAHYTPCVNNQRTLMHEWIYPLACANPENATLPENVVESCVPEPCKPGQQRTNPNEMCQYCPLGFAGSGSQCVPCNSGLAAENRIAYFDHWTSWPQGDGYSFKTNCSGEDCVTNGWRLGHNLIDSGVGHGGDTFSFVDMTIDIYPNSVVTFNYSLPCSAGNELIFSYSDFVLNSFPCSDSCDAGFKTFNFTFRNFFFSENNKNESMTLRFGYAKHNPNSLDCDRAIISDIRVVGVALTPGGSGGCVTCRSGTYATDEVAVARCTSCPVGYGNSNGVNCELCPERTFSDSPGSPCQTCGRMTASNSTRAQCTFNCSAITFFSALNATEPLVYNVSAIGNWNASVFIFATNMSVEYRFHGGLCDWNPACHDRRGHPMHSHLCYHNSSFTVNMGKAPAINEAGPRGGLRFDYSYGSQFPFSRSVSCTSTVFLLCHKDEELSSPVFSSPITDLNNNCHTELTFKSKYGCPLCRQSDFAYFDSSCERGKKVRSWYVKTSECYGGIPLPIPEEMDCGPELTFRRNTIIIAVVLSFAVLTGAGAGLIVLYMRNKKLHHDYNMLVSQNVPMDTKESSAVRE